MAKLVAINVVDLHAKKLIGVRRVSQPTWNGSIRVDLERCRTLWFDRNFDCECKGYVLDRIISDDL